MITSGARTPMPHDMSPEVSSSIITGISTFATGVVGTWATLWARRKRTAAEDPRCIAVCNRMITIGEILVAVIKATNSDNLAIAPHLTRLEDEVRDAKAFVEGLDK